MEPASSEHLVDDARDCTELEENYCAPSGWEIIAWRLFLNQKISLSITNPRNLPLFGATEESDFLFLSIVSLLVGDTCC